MIDEHGWIIDYVSEQLKNDKDIICQAMEKESCNFMHASNQLKNDREFVMFAVEKGSWNFE